MFIEATDKLKFVEIHGKGPLRLHILYIVLALTEIRCRHICLYEKVLESASFVRTLGYIGLFYILRHPTSPKSLKNELQAYFRAV